MKVLIVFNHPAPYKVRIFNELSKYADLTVIFERNKESDRPDEFYVENKYDFESITLEDGYIGTDGSYSNKVKEYIKEHHQEFDLIVMNGYKHIAEMKAIKYMARHNIPFTLLINGGVIRKNELFLKKMFKSQFISKAQYYMSPSAMSDDYLVYYGADKNKIFRYPYSNIGDDEILKDKPNKEEIRKEFSLPLDKKIFINASQFIDRKNNIFLLSQFIGKNDVILLVGEGEERQKYLDYIEKNSMDNAIIMPFIEKQKLFHLFQGCDAFITLAKEDIFGHTVLEAMANGLPVICSTKVNSGLEYIENGVNGYLVNLDNSKEIQTAISKITNINCHAPIETVKKATYEASGKKLYEIMKEIINHE